MSRLLIGLLTLGVFCPALVAQEAAALPNIPRQPMLAQVHRLIEAMDVVGNPFDAETIDRLTALKSLPDDQQVVAEVQQLLDPYCLAIVDVQPEGAPKVRPGSAKRELLEQGWRTFLVKVINTPRRTNRLLIESPNARPLPHAPADEIPSRWMQISSFDGQPMRPDLSGLPLEYRIVQVYSRDVGTKNAALEFTVSSGPGDDGELFREWRFDKDTDGWHAMNQCEIKAENGSLQFKSTGEDPFMGAEVEGRGGPLILRFWANCEESGIGQLFWWTKDLPQATGDRQTNFVIHKGKDHLYEIPFHVDGTLAGVRLDPLVRPGNVRIDWIYLYAATRSENWAKLDVDFDCVPATQVTFRVFDAEGKPGFGKFEIRDNKGRIYPAQSKRLAPDFFFQRHIYRGDQETIQLPPGEYSIVCSRGPETIPESKTLTVGEEPVQFHYRVKRWIDPAKLGWWSGDHHIHAAGCLHYENPTQGVQPNDMIRHIMGEDLKVGCCLTWGPCFDYQKRFFTGEVAEQSQYPYTLRYDVEVSGFGSHMSGHLNLLNLKQQIYPGGESKDHWPTLGLNTLRWAKRQGAVCGPAHSSIGLSRFIGRVPNTEDKDGPRGLPNFKIPAYDGIGANEFVVDVTHQVPGPDGQPVQAVDFISAMNTERVAEWNMWYHVLNCGIRVAVSGETDFPCMSGERVGIGRVYAHVDQELTFAKWVQSIAEGRSYVSDGNCHLMNYQATRIGTNQTLGVGQDGGELQVNSGDSIGLSVTAAARLPGSPEVPVELIVNGYPVQKQLLRADGGLQELSFEAKVQESQWVAIRVFPHAHTNPIYVVCDGKPIRGPIASIRWCLAGVDQCWKSKQPTYAEAEQQEAEAAYEHARTFYRRLLEEADAQ
ncbi:CehA/McbA family metallohydrolase [Stieleria mannarensis]|uniref:CehA/McbA family metallohydrolase n=1 Tax=Stieleria mannarensis TaxID=2755585 RepID=UPI0016018D80|nr:CehA/McbA family metallohydrolase [Rhodopirellula sp. JC639]